MLDSLRFWLVLQLFGLAALPLAWRLFAALPDRGYAFAKPLGLLGAGYLLWLGASLGLMRNTTGGVVLCLLLFFAAGVWLGRSGWQADAQGERPLWTWLRSQRRHILFCEALFTLAFAAWTAFRAFNPDIAGTEKPMEFAFLNGILGSPLFPPRDPWLAGFGISYYYFGYVMLAMLVQLSGVAPGIAFNLGLAAVFALTLLGAFGVLYNWLLGTGVTKVAQGRRYGLLAAFFVGIMGNLEGVLEALHARGWLNPTLYAFFDIKELQSAPASGSFYPGPGQWWWWRAARTLHDRTFDGLASQEVIDEFPFFSFLLGDMHPHVLALPFVLLVIALALNLFLTKELSSSPIVVASSAVQPAWRSAWSRVRAGFGLDGQGFLLYALALGALGFLNTWDFPIYVFLLTLVYLLRRGLAGAPLDRSLWGEAAWVFGGLALIGFALYLPFYLSFTSQASGFLPNLYNPTRFIQYFLMFGPFLAALCFLLLTALRQVAPGRRVASQWLLAVWLLPLFFLILVIAFTAVAPSLSQQITQALGRAPAEIIARALSLRASTPATWLLVGALLALTGALASRVWARRDQMHPGLVFTLALFGVALLLTYGVEFVYLRDSFGTRMNTVFKFYYQAWIMMALAAAFALFYVRSHMRGGVRAIASAAVTLLAVGGLVYPTLAIPSKANNFDTEPALDGTRFVRIYRPDEANVIVWLQTMTPADAVILEAPGGSYTDANTISAHSGRATLLGWGGHELQWRGSYAEPGRREPMIEAIYRNQDQDRIRAIVAEFGIDYLIVGPREADKYNISADRLRTFERLWEVVFADGGYTVYRWRG